jgi:hypothetical protein
VEDLREFTAAAQPAAAAQNHRTGRQKKATRQPRPTGAVCQHKRMRLVHSCAVVIAALAWAPRAAAAQHDHGSHGGGSHGHHGDHEDVPRSTFSAAVGVVAASYESMLYEGNYEGLGVSGRWSRGRFAAAIDITGYRLVKNGKAVTGPGDLMLHGHAMLLRAGTVTGGAVAMIMAPTGDDQAGLGMGHVMLMPGAWLQWAPGRVAVAASGGYARGLGDESIHAEHGEGSWPLVDPMSFSEITFGASGMVALARSLRAGVRLTGAVPLRGGTARLATGVRAVWTWGRVETTAELLGGAVGAPFGVHGLLEAAVRFY